MPKVQNIRAFYRGEVIAWVFTMTKLTDITGWNISARIKLTDDAAALLTIPALLTAPTAGVFTINILDTQTASLPAATYRYDVWRTDANAEACLSIGSVTVKGSPRVP